MSSEPELPDGFLGLVDDYCSEVIDEGAMRRLETMLLENEAARRYFVEYFHHHTEIQFAIRARRAADAVLGQLSAREESAVRPERGSRPSIKQIHSRWWIGLA